jgi:hypothetical protein
LSVTLRIIVDIYTAHLTVDITLALRGRIKIAASQRGVTVADMLRNLQSVGARIHPRRWRPPHLAPIANAGHAPQADAGTLLTEVELTWLEGRHRALGPLRSRRGETILDCRHRTLSFTPRNVFGRWLSLQRLRHRHLAHRHRACGRPWRNLSDQMVFFVRPGGDILLRIRGLAKGLASPPSDRRRGGALHQSGRRRPRSLA